jgi:hypothetical protein
LFMVAWRCPGDMTERRFSEPDLASEPKGQLLVVELPACNVLRPAVVDPTLPHRSTAASPQNGRLMFDKAAGSQVQTGAVHRWKLFWLTLAGRTGP